MLAAAISAREEALEQNLEGEEQDVVTTPRMQSDLRFRGGGPAASETAAKRPCTRTPGGKPAGDSPKLSVANWASVPYGSGA